ncbi:MAG: hypothetical protein R8G33_12150 [Gammaproteobacteria bacterium]|nr:hypothetical protein [Gammaproteobacteria bacterium]
MKYIIEHYIRLAFLSAKPQDCPLSLALQKVLICLYLFLSIINALAIYEVSSGAVYSVVDLILLYVFTKLILRGKKERFNQTFNAFLGVGIFIGLLHTICSYSFIVDQNTQMISALGKSLFFIIFIWIIIAYGHIVRHAAELNFSAGLSISLGYTLLNAMLLVSISEMLRI